MKKNTTPILIALTLICTMAISLIALSPSVSGDEIFSVPDRKTGSYLSVNPPVIGVDQPLTVSIQIYPPPSGPHTEHGSYLGPPPLWAVWYEGKTGYDGNPLYGLHFEDITVTFTRPDGSTDSFMPLSGSYHALNTLPGMTEETGGLWFHHYPKQVGEWTVQFSFPGQSFTFLNYTVNYLPSTSNLVRFTVVEDPVQIGLPPVPLPINYWERPISPMNREWWVIGGDWLDNTVHNNFNPYTTAPSTAHILWKKQGQAEAGLVGGEGGWYSYAGGGLSMQRIWNGRVYYTYTHPTDGSMIVCADLLTGEPIWERPGGISLMYLVDPTTPFAHVAAFYENPTVHLWHFTTTAWTRYSATTGAVAQTISAAPGQTIPGMGSWDSSMTYAYFVDAHQRLGNVPGWTLRRTYCDLIGWNMSAAGNWHQRIMFNVSLIQPDGTDPGYRTRYHVVTPKGLILVSGLVNERIWAFDMYTGEELWMHTLDFSKTFEEMITTDGRYVVFDAATMTYHCFELTRTGMRKEWVTEVQPGMMPWGAAHRGPLGGSEAYGNMYTCGYNGQIECWDLATGEIKWTYFTESFTELPMGTHALPIPHIADGKGYVGNAEHTPTQPMSRGGKLFCFDAHTGEPIWNITGYFTINAISNGYLLATDTIYTGYTYCFGKGKTETTIEAPLTAITHGQGLVLRGTVMDMSPAQPNTPAISDEDMTTWMNYLHMQDAELINNPPDPKGVEVRLDTIDPNNNFVHLGTVTSTASGTYGLDFTPEVPGLYRIIATFEGSESYWGSYAETFLYVEQASATIEPTPPPASVADMYFVPAIAGLIIAIALVGAVIVLMLRKR